MPNNHTAEQLSRFYHSGKDECSLPIDIAIMWGAFLHQGLMNTLGVRREQDILDHWQLGCIELINDVADYLPVVWNTLYQQWDGDEQYQGIIEVEVISVLGHYLGDYILLHHGQLPTLDEVQAMIHTLVYSYLENVSSTITFR